MRDIKRSPVITAPGPSNLAPGMLRASFVLDIRQSGSTSRAVSGTRPPSPAFSPSPILTDPASPQTVTATTTSDAGHASAFSKAPSSSALPFPTDRGAGTSRRQEVDGGVRLECGRRVAEEEDGNDRERRGSAESNSTLPPPYFSISDES